MTREEYIKFANALKNNYTIDFDKLPEFCDMAISALSAEGEFIKKEDTIEYLNDLFGEMYHVSFGNVLQSLDSLQTYSFPDSAENKGEWIYDKSIYNWRCSECGETPPPTGYVGKSEFMATHFKFCNYCGADMRKAEKTETCKGCLEPCIMYEPDMRACKKKVREVIE